MTGCGVQSNIDAGRFDENLVWRRISVEGAPTLVETPDYHWISLPDFVDRSDPSRSPWQIHYDSDLFDTKKIVSGRAYRFEIFEDTESTSGKRRHVNRSLYRIFDGQQVIFDAGTCRLHNCKMTRRVLDYEDGYGYPQLAKESTRRFPNAGREYLLCNALSRSVGWSCPVCVNTEGIYLRRADRSNIPVPSHMKRRVEQDAP
jgi:hypothetical protein